MNAQRVQKRALEETGWFSSKRVKLVVGLGNPSSRYKYTYHNVGFFIVDVLAAKNIRPRTLQRKKELRSFLNLTPERTGALFSAIQEAHYIFAKPRTFMNVSGKAVAAALAQFKIRKEDMLIVHDDADLPLGEWKFSYGSGAAGHHGVASIVEQLGSKNFWRLRVGIRKKEGRAGDFVLSKMSARDRSVFYFLAVGLMEKLMENETVC